MTTIYEEKKRCGVCGSENKYTGIGSTNTFGSPDLDTRPPEMQRSTIYAWIQRCPDCGYCNSDVSKSRSDEPVIVKGADYQSQLNDPAYPALANSFLCKAISDRAAGNFADTTWDLIRAAWVCDDSGHAEQAKTCRQMAADMLELSQAHKQKVAGEDRAQTAILVDLLRRGGQPERAQRMLAKQAGEATQDVIERVLGFQGLLLERRDFSRHTIAEAVGK